MLDRYNRDISYLRISVTDRCNLRCAYCMPQEGIRLISHQDILSYEEIMEVVRESVDLGIRKVRITGGEPLVRKGVVGLVRMISEIKEVEDLGLTTNGILLSDYADELAKAGLHRVNISLDTIDPERYSKITRGGDIGMVFRGIEAARKAGLGPVKINCVIRDSAEEQDALAVRKFCDEKGLELRFIHEMDLASGGFSIVEGGTGGDCSMCNRLRLTANGFIKPCLFDNIGFSIRELGVKEALQKAVHLKPEKGTVNSINKFHNIGG
jgi:GTP 3',8-cyclase